jgi:uncharacterized protein
MQTQFTVAPDSFVFVNGKVVILIKAGDVHIPIWIGPTEAFAIQNELLGAETPRPLTHNLFRNALIALDAPITKAVITELRGKIYIASVFIRKDGTEIPIDARPSDAIALAIRFGAPLFVEDEVMIKTLESEEIKQFLEFLEINIPSAMGNGDGEAE